MVPVPGTVYVYVHVYLNGICNTRVSQKRLEIQALRCNGDTSTTATTTAITTITITFTPTAAPPPRPLQPTQPSLPHYHHHRIRHNHLCLCSP